MTSTDNTRQVHIFSPASTYLIILSVLSFSSLNIFESCLLLYISNKCFVHHRLILLIKVWLCAKSSQILVWVQKRTLDCQIIFNQQFEKTYTRTTFCFTVYFSSFSTSELNQSLCMPCMSNYNA